MSDAIDFLAWAGRLHPVLLHFPVALVLLAAGLSIGPWREKPGALAAARVTLILAVPAALVTAATGWALARDERPSEALELHRWLGLASAALVLAAWLVARRRAGLLARSLLLAAAAGTIAASHVGASLVWGARWLWPPPAMGEPKAEPALPPAGLAAQAEPERALEAGLAAGARALLARRCVSCHGPSKQKADLRLDLLSELLASPRGRELLRPGEPAASELLRLVSLPADDLDLMPAEGEPLAPDEIALLRAWIAAGAPR